MQNFITRNDEGRLVQHTLDWNIFVEDFLSMAKTVGEMDFIGQLVEDLQYRFEERLEEMEEGDL